jgi:hypothetical protein
MIDTGHRRLPIATISRVLANNRYRPRLVDSACSANGRYRRYLVAQAGPGEGPQSTRCGPSISVTVMVSAEGIAARLAELPTRKEMWRAVLFGVTTGACLVQCLA